MSTDNVQRHSHRQVGCSIIEAMVWLSASAPCVLNGRAQQALKTPTVLSCHSFSDCLRPCECGTPNLRPIAMYSTDSISRMSCHDVMPGWQRHWFKLPGLLP